MTTRILGWKGNRTRRSQKASCRATTSRRPPTRYERSHARKVNLCIIQVPNNGQPPEGHAPRGGTRRDLRANFHTSRYTTVWKGNMVTLQQQIAEKFLAGLAASKDVDIEKIEQLRRLLADTKKPKPEEFVRIFSLTAGDDLK